MPDDTDYLEIPVPEEKPKTDWNYYERRAELADRIRQQGHPTGFNYAAIGREFDVSRETIRHDFEKLRDYFREHIGRDAKMTADLAYRKIVREALEPDEDGNVDHDAARRALDSWTHWLFETGEEPRAPKRVDADVTTREADKESESYRVLDTDDETIEAEGGTVAHEPEADVEHEAE